MTFEEYLKTLSFDRLVWLWNEYCWGEKGCAENEIYDSSTIVISYLATWLKDEEHEVYDEWVDYVTGEFLEHLAANVGTTELYKLWLGYEGEPDGDETMIDVFDIEVLADDLIKDNHEYFQDWLSEQEDDESALLEEQRDEE